MTLLLKNFELKILNTSPFKHLFFQCQRCKSLFPTIEASEHHASLCYKNAPLIKLHIRNIESLVSQTQENMSSPKSLTNTGVTIFRDSYLASSKTRASPNSGVVSQERVTYQHCGICSKAVSGKNNDF